MRTLAIGDIHGCSKALDALLRVVAPAADDLLVALGDYINRGPDSSGVLNRLIELHATGRLIALCGNHEQMLIDGSEPNALRLTPTQKQFVFECLVDWHEIDTHFFVHANAYPDIPLDEQPTFMLRWEHLVDSAPHESGKIMVCGHMPQKNGVPLNLGHAICIDTHAWGGAWLTGLDVKSGRYWQANERGETRTRWIDEV